MNRGVFQQVVKGVRELAFNKVTFDAAESVSNTDEPGMTGPDWLAPFTLTYAQDGILHVAAKGFIVEFADPRYAQAPARFRGVHYCHLIAPDYLTRLMSGKAETGAIVGRVVAGGAPPGQE
jgi:hypothetical protein